MSAQALAKGCFRRFLASILGKHISIDLPSNSGCSGKEPERIFPINPGLNSFAPGIENTRRFIPRGISV
jgi:hypothetical protein